MKKELKKRKKPSDLPDCDSCGQQMKLQKGGHVRTSRGHKCRIRRFHCDLCNIDKTIYANGSFDEDDMPEIAKDDQQKLFKQQEDYNKNF